MSFLNDMKEFLTQQGIPGEIAVGPMADQPVECMALLETQGLPPDQMARVETPGLQITVRTDEFAGGYQKLKQAYHALVQIGWEGGQLPEGVIMSGLRYFRVYPVSSGMATMEKDEARHVNMTQEFYVVKEEEKNGN